MNQTTYDLADFGAVADSPGSDVAAAFNAVFADMDGNDPDSGGRILIPPGDYYLNSPVTIDRDFVTVEGTNYGWQTGTGNGGGSRLIVRAMAGIRVPVASQRTRGLVFRNFMLDGEAVANSRTGLDIQNDNDGLVIEGIAAKEFLDAVVVRNADAAYIAGNLLAENNSCLRLINNGIANIVADNRLGAKPQQITFFAENQDRLVVAGNNFFPDGYSNVVVKDCSHSTITGNQFQSFYTGMLFMEGANCNNNSVVSNTFVSENPPVGTWNVNPAQQFADDFGIIRVEGDNNVVAANQIDSAGTATHVMIRLVGNGNHVSDCVLNARNGSNQKVRIDGGTAIAPNIVVDCTTAAETSFAATSQHRFRELPPAAIG